jgi:amino-acid N-acetyltransferase
MSTTESELNSALRERRALADATSFSEKGFYLSELRDRTIAIALASEPGNFASLARLLDELAENRTRVVIVSAPGGIFDTNPDALRAPVESIAELDSLAGRVWRLLSLFARVVVVANAEEDFGTGCANVVRCLGIRKLVWVDAEGGLVRSNGERESFIDAVELGERLRNRPPRAALLGVIQRILDTGVDAVNLCRMDGVADELFTYDGSGTLFTAQGYVEVRRLGIDDFDAAADLVERGTTEGYLAPRSPGEIERVLASGFGAFVGGNHLAGIGTLLRYVPDRAAEIGSLYTLTRFLGEGVGGHVVRFAMEVAEAEDCDFAFACTTAVRVVDFFERNGFRRVDADQIPADKWHGYDAVRRAKVTCVRREIRTTEP